MRLEHSSSHQFVSLDRPGEVIVHTVFSGDDERAQPPNRSVALEAEPIVHQANCNLCDSRIWGDRFKCLTCPDFDTCASCFTITPEQHPGHSFEKLLNQKSSSKLLFRLDVRLILQRAMLAGDRSLGSATSA
ncbi:hypothetical protein A0H81_01514 [Grifola frondosa]|uniref:ZZ-type domain-containing protein n=1 Tax=Grifola frondosa TaxID=5627 RepID=A0A1C7MXK3_GRIFR|nr:hypothetical protein A0H81_01514 [Grifola frondosa]